MVRSLGNVTFHRNDIPFAGCSALNFFFARAFEEKLDRFLQHGPGFLDGIALAGNVQLGAKSHKTVFLSFNQRGKVRGSHNTMLILSRLFS